MTRHLLPFLLPLFPLSAVTPLGAQVSPPASRGAQAPAVTVERIDCLPRAENGVIHADLTREVGGASARLFFKWDQGDRFYWVPMRAMGGGRYWGVPPRPDEGNQAVEYYAALVDPEAGELARSAALMAPATESCKVRLTAQQRGEADNLTVGETVPEQAGREVAGFLCDGIVSRVDSRGVLRGDERCRACVIP
jgi:hypothetical protein